MVLLMAVSPVLCAQMRERASFVDRCAVKTNVFEWLITVPNIGLEYDIVHTDHRKITLSLAGKYNWNTYHENAPATVFDMADIRPEIRYYFRSENHKISRPWWVMYVGAYASCGSYTFKMAPKGISGQVRGVGASAGYVLPLYDYAKGAVDVELGMSLGMQGCTRDVFTHNPVGHYYTRLDSESKGMHLTPFPVISELRVAFVWRNKSMTHQVIPDDTKIKAKAKYEKDLSLMEEDILNNLPLDLVDSYQGNRDALEKEIKDRVEYLKGENAIRNSSYSFKESTKRRLDKEVDRRAKLIIRKFEEAETKKKEEGR